MLKSFHCFFIVVCYFVDVGVDVGVCVIPGNLVIMLWAVGDMYLCVLLILPLLICASQLTRYQILSVHIRQNVVLPCRLLSIYVVCSPPPTAAVGINVRMYVLLIMLTAVSGIFFLPTMCRASFIQNENKISFLFLPSVTMWSIVDRT